MLALFDQRMIRDDSDRVILVILKKIKVEGEHNKKEFDSMSPTGTKPAHVLLTCLFLVSIEI